MDDPGKSRVLTPSNAPIFFSFFIWGFGTGAQHIVRPLFALALTGNIFLVGVLTSFTGLPRLFTGPITGYLTDRVGRKPLVVLGAALRGATNVGQFFADDFWLFLALEFVGQIGIMTWVTSSNVLLSDVTTTGNRGRVLALRQMSTRVGFVAGPVVAGVLATTFGLRSLFLLNGASKIVIVLVVLFMVRETRPEHSPEPEQAAPRPAPARVAAVINVMRDRSFLALAIAASAMSMAQTTLVQTLLPIHAQEHLGTDESGVGFLISIAGVMAFLLAFPNGMLSDRFGRKVSMVPGMLLLSSAAAILMVADVYMLAVLAVVVLGSGEGMTMGTSQSYAMDLAPAEGRGLFLGIAAAFQSGGAILGPLIIGSLYHAFGPAAGFGAMAAWLAAAALTMGVMGRETAGSRRSEKELVG